jgi:hypothetical protein
MPVTNNCGGLSCVGAVKHMIMLPSGSANQSASCPHGPGLNVPVHSPLDSAWAAKPSMVSTATHTAVQIGTSSLDCRAERRTNAEEPSWISAQPLSRSQVIIVALMLVRYHMSDSSSSFTTRTNIPVCIVCTCNGRIKLTGNSDVMRIYCHEETQIASMERAWAAQVIYMPLRAHSTGRWARLTYCHKRDHRHYLRVRQSARNLPVSGEWRVKSRSERLVMAQVLYR